MSISKIVFEAEAWQNKKYCFCSVGSSKYNYHVVSNEIKITVYCKCKDYFFDVLITFTVFFNVSPCTATLLNGLLKYTLKSMFLLSTK
jgi:hypothetical protein